MQPCIVLVVRRSPSSKEGCCGKVHREQQAANSRVGGHQSSDVCASAAASYVNCHTQPNRGL